MMLASDRYVLPLKSNFKGRIQASSTIGQYRRTCYFEPLCSRGAEQTACKSSRREREEERKKCCATLRISAERIRCSSSARRDPLGPADVSLPMRVGVLLDGACATISPDGKTTRRYLPCSARVTRFSRSSADPQAGRPAPVTHFRLPIARFARPAVQRGGKTVHARDAGCQIGDAAGQRSRRRRVPSSRVVDVDSRVHRRRAVF